MNGIRSFVAAGHNLSFTKAALDLGVTQGAVSRMVQALEAELGVQLFQRVGRSITFTTAGASYHRQVSEALDRVAAATRFLHQTEAGCVLTISVLPTLAMRWLVPRLPQFQSRHPALLVNLVAGDGPVDFDRDPVDVALRYGIPPWSGAAATPLLVEEVGVVCAPALADPALRTPAGLAGRRLLRHSTRSDAWADYFTSFGMAVPALRHAPGFEHFFLLIEAAATGLGYVLAPLFLVREELASGRLVQAVPHTRRPAAGYYILHREGAARFGKVRLVMEWLLGEARLVAETAASAPDQASSICKDASSEG